MVVKSLSAFAYAKFSDRRQKDEDEEDSKKGSSAARRAAMEETVGKDEKKKRKSQKIVDVYVARYEERQKIKHIVSMFKLTATLALLALGVFINHTLFRMWSSMVSHYRKLKMAKEKRKQRKKRRGKRILNEL